MLRVRVTRIVDAEFWKTRSSSRTHLSGSGEKKRRGGASRVDRRGTEIALEDGWRRRMDDLNHGVREMEDL